MENVSKVICVLTIVTVARDQLWAKMRITLKMVSMAMVAMHQNTDYIKMVSMAVAMEMDLYLSNHCCSVDMEGVMKLWEDPHAWFLPYT